MAWWLQLDSTAVLDVRQLVGQQNSEYRVLLNTPSTASENDRQQSSNSYSERKTRLIRSAAIDIGDSESQTSSSCPTSSSTTSTTPPKHLSPPPPSTQHETASSTNAVAPWGTVTSMCRVRPLTNTDWRRSDLDQRETATSLPEPAVPPPVGDQRDGVGGGGPLSRKLPPKSAIAATALTTPRCVLPPSSIGYRLYDDECAISVDDVLNPDHRESKATVYDNVQQVHV